MIQPSSFTALLYAKENECVIYMKIPHTSFEMNALTPILGTVEYISQPQKRVPPISFLLLLSRMPLTLFNNEFSVRFIKYIDSTIFLVSASIQLSAANVLFRM